ncbi:MAG: bifunctional diguanylate cyclase/phosphodiesterase [Devosia sp.]
MLTLQSILFRHDLILVLVAALVCALSAFAGITLLDHARRSRGRSRTLWLTVAATSVGFGIWSTHFVAMLAFHAGMPVGYNVMLTVVSLLLAILIVGGALWLAVVGTSKTDPLLAGAILGAGISAMHYTGMAALLIGGTVGWDWRMVGASILLGMGLGGGAIWTASHATSRSGQIVATLLLTAAICAMHFTAMAAVNLENCYAIVEDSGASSWLWLIVALTSASVLALAIGGTAIDLRDRRFAAESSRMRELANAAFEGIVMVRDGVISDSNTAFSALVGDAGSLAGRPLADYLDAETCGRLLEQPNALVETELRGASAAVPVELVAHEMTFQGTTHLAIAVRDLTARKRAEERIRYLAHHDSLTGLPNRASFGERLDTAFAQARDRHTSVAVLCLDLDRFKDVNDLRGHAAGDALLRRVGNVLRSVVDGIGYPARLGGDEFAVVLASVDSVQAANQVADQLLRAMAADNSAHPEQARASASIGVAVFPDHADTPELLMSAADRALYWAKDSGRGAWRQFEAVLEDELRDRRMLERDLAFAIERQQLHLVYQPQFELSTMQVTGYEALARWTHPERGLVPPSVFIPMAEENGLIEAIGAHVLELACMEAAGWPAHLTLAVNVSAAQLYSPSFVSFVRQTLYRAGLSPQRLELEVTETALVRDIVGALTTLRQVRAMGVGVAIDDFGTGYSSLAHVLNFPFSRIKLDQSFVRSLASNQQAPGIVRSVIALGRNVGTPVVAEGVERQAELDFLRDEGCEVAQGFLLGRPGRMRGGVPDRNPPEAAHAEPELLSSVG